MLRHVQCTFPNLCWLIVVAAACSLAACGGSIGGDSVTGSPITVSPSEPELDLDLESTVEQAKKGRRHRDRDDDDDDDERGDRGKRHRDRDDDDDDGDRDDDDDDEKADRGRRHRDRDDDDKVLVCHKGRKNLWVSRRAVRGHERHGDTLGRCRDSAPSATCPCFSKRDINAAASSCSPSSVAAQCGTGDPYFLFLSCTPGGGVPAMSLGIYLSQSSDGGSCSREDVNGSVIRNGLTNAEYQACVNVINGSGYC